MATYEDWFEKNVKDPVRYGSTYQIPRGQTPSAPSGYGSTYQIPLPSTEAQTNERVTDFTPNVTSQLAERGRSSARAQRDVFRRAAAETPTPPPGPSGPSISSVFAPLFDALNQQRRNAESRYSANAGQIQNIYGQLIGARSADVDDIQEAYSRLQEAAASRGESTLGKMEAREQARQAENQAVLQSMGVGDIGSAAGDVASEMAAVAQDVEMMNQSNWAGMLDVMGKTSEELARADVTSYGYRQMEDIAKLQAAKEDYLNDVANQEFELKFQEQQAKLAAAQAAAQAQAEAQAAAAKAQAQAEQESYDRSQAYLRSADPLTAALGQAAIAGLIDQTSGENVRAAFSDWMSKSTVAKNQMTTVPQALADAEQFLTGRVSPQELSVIRSAIAGIYK